MKKLTNKPLKDDEIVKVKGALIREYSSHKKNKYAGVISFRSYVGKDVEEVKNKLINYLETIISNLKETD